MFLMFVLVSRSFSYIFVLLINTLNFAVPETTDDAMIATRHWCITRRWLKSCWTWRWCWRDHEINRINEWSTQEILFSLLKYQQFVQHLSGEIYRIFARRDYYYFINLLWKKCREEDNSRLDSRLDRHHNQQEKWTTLNDNL